MNIIPIILSGGSGTRLWPLSRAEYPKQYQALTSKKTMLQETILRLNGLKNITKPIIICNQNHRFFVAQQLAGINTHRATILLEPVAKNSAPAIAAASYWAQQNTQENSILLVLSADHLIADVKAFHQAIDIAMRQASNNKIVTFGVVPTQANTDYGYIKFKSSDDEAYPVVAFVEKPNQTTAQQYLASKEYLWNSGMFAFKSDVLLSDLTKYAPEIANNAQQSVVHAKQDLDFIRLDEHHFNCCPSDSIDYALMENTQQIMVVPLLAGWNDIGSWLSLDEASRKDTNNNSITGQVVSYKTSNTYVNAPHHLVATLGVKELIIVNTPDATLVASKDKVDDIKPMLELLKTSHPAQTQYHRKVYRPWGWYDSIESGKNFQIKRLLVNPKAKLSLQSHKHRAEHWVVVSGVATVTNYNKTFNLNKGESTYIPAGVKHALENKTNELLEIIEVQSGAYLGEDDIERFEDIYGRIKK